MTRHIAKRLHGIAIILALCAFLLLKPTTGEAQNFPSGRIGASKAEVVGTVVGIAAVGAGIGVGVYFLVRHNHTLTGCTASGADGLMLQNEGDRQSYYLVGMVAGIKPEARVRVSGLKKGTHTGSDRTFLVEKPARNLGPCHASPPTP